MFKYGDFIIIMIYVIKYRFKYFMYNCNLVYIIIGLMISYLYIINRINDIILIYYVNILYIMILVT